MDKQEIMKILPHREDMLLLDEAGVNEDGSGWGKYTVNGDEFFLRGHYPGNPIVPGVILCEILAQSSCVLFKDSLSTGTPYFTGMDKVRFKKKVTAGDTFCTLIKCTRTMKPFYFMEVKGFVNDEIAVIGELSFAIT